MIPFPNGRVICWNETRNRSGWLRCTQCHLQIINRIIFTIWVEELSSLRRKQSLFWLMHYRVGELLENFIGQIMCTFGRISNKIQFKHLFIILNSLFSNPWPLEWKNYPRIKIKIHIIICALITRESGSLKICKQIQRNFKFLIWDFYITKWNKALLSSPLEML